MKRVGSYLRWIALVFGSLLLLGVVGGVLFIRTERFQILLRDQVVSALNTSFRGDVGVERIEGSIWRNVTLHNLTIQHQGTDILYVPHLTIQYSLLPLLQGRMQISRVEVVEPVVQLKQDAAGTWNILEALAPEIVQPEAAPTQEGGLAMHLDTVTVQGARIDVTLARAAEQTYYLTETTLDAKIEKLPTGLEIQVRRLASRITASGLPEVQAEAALVYEGTVTPAAVRISAFSLHTPHSHLHLTGTVNDLSTLNTDAELVIKNLAVADAAQIVPGWPLKEALSGKLQVTGPLADLHTNLTLAVADAQIAAEVQADLSQQMPRYQGEVTVRRFDVQKLLAREDLAGVVEGTIRANGAGIALADLNGKVSLQAQALRVASWQIGDMALNGSIEQGAGKLNGEVRGGLGRAHWQGAVTLAEEPRYELALSIEDLNLKKVTTGEKSVSGDLNLTGTLKGTGLALPTMDAQTEIELRPSTIGPLQIQRGRLDARIADGRIRIAEATLAATDTTLTVQGEMGTTPEEKGRLLYTLQATDLSPWLSLASRKGSGALTLTGEASGNIAALQARGELKAADVRVDEAVIQRGTVTFDLNNLGQPQPEGTLTAVFEGIQTGVELQTLEATVTLPRGQQQPAPLSAQVAVKVRDTTAHSHRLNAEVAYQPAQLAVRLSTLSLELLDGTWQLTQPVQIVQNTEGIVVERFLLANGDQQVLLEGSLSSTGAQDLRVQIDRFTLAALRPLLSQHPEVSGMLSARVQVGGTAARPSLDGTAHLTGLRVAGQDYKDLSTAVVYKEEKATLELTFRQDAEHALSANGSLPLAMSWAEGWKTQVLGDVDFRVHSSGLSLAFLNAFSGKAVQGVAGELSLDFSLQGPASRPLPRGNFQLRDGQAMVNPLGVQISAITIAGAVDPENVRITQIAAQARDGRLQGSGTIALRGYAPTDLKVSLSAEHWPAIHTRQYQAEIGGEVRAEGPLTAARVTGQLEVLQATLRPDLAFLQDTPVQRDDTIVIRHTGSSSTPSTVKEEQEKTQTPPQTDTFQNLALDLTVAVPRNTWVRHANADIELAGEVRATKQPGEELALVGAIETVRGWVGFQGRRFTLTQGRVVFTGGKEINPGVDIVAQYRLPDYQVEVVVDGTAQKPSLTFRSEPKLEQADILAVLLFGKPTTALSQGEKMDLQQQALKVTSGYAAAKIGESVSQALGLEQLGIDLREVDFTGGRIGFGRYVSPNTYVSMSQDIAGKKGQEVSVEYSLSPGWKTTTSTSAGGNSEAGILWHKEY